MRSFPSHVACRLSREELPLPPGGDSGTFFPVEDREIILQLVPKLNTEVVGEDRVSLRLPPAGEIAPVFFDVKATHLGMCEVLVVARQGPVPLLTLQLKASVEEKLSGDVSGRATTGDRVSAEPIEGVDNLQWFTIRESVNGDKVVYLYDIVDDQLGLSASGRSPELGNRADYVKSLYTEIENYWEASGKDSTGFQPLLQDFGSSLFSQLFQEPFQKVLWSYRDKLSRLVVQSDEPFIPWELVHLKEPGQRRPQEPHFLAQLGLVRWLNTAPGGFPPKTLRARPGKVRYLRAKYLNPHTNTLDETGRRRKFMVKRLGAKPIEPTVAAVRDLLGRATSTFSTSPGTDVPKKTVSSKP